MCISMCVWRCMCEGVCVCVNIEYRCTYDGTQRNHDDIYCFLCVHCIFISFFFLLGPLYSIRNLAPALALPAREMLWWRGGREGSSLIGTSHWLALSRKHHHNSKSASSMLGPKHKEEISVLVNPELGRCHSHHNMAWGRADASHCLHTISFIFYLNLKKLLSLSFGFGLQVSGTGHFTWSVRTKSCCVCVRMSVCVCQCVCVGVVVFVTVTVTKYRKNDHVALLICKYCGICISYIFRSGFGVCIYRILQVD